MSYLWGFFVGVSVGLATKSVAWGMAALFFTTAIGDGCDQIANELRQIKKRAQ